MSKVLSRLLLLILLLNCFKSEAQLRAVITDLNNKKEFELKVGDTFYFGLAGQSQKIKGTLEAVTLNELQIAGKKYACKEIIWIDRKGRKPKKNAGQISRILLYFGGGLAAFSAYEVAADNSNKQAIVGTSVGVGLMTAALCWKLLPNPEYDFTTRYLLETLAPVVSPEK